MKLLFDQNISFRIVRMISQEFPEAKQVRDVDLENATDLMIWEFAKQNHYTIVTFDADFYELSNLNGHPPKIIWMRTGNRATSELANLLLDKSTVIKDFLSESSFSDIACIELGG